MIIEPTRTSERKYKSWKSNHGRNEEPHETHMYESK